jgi:MFS family permease
MRLLPPSATPDARRLLWSRALRAFADGFVSVLLPVYLLALGFDALEVGVLATATLLGSATLTIVVGTIAAGHDQRRLLMAIAALMTATGLGFAAIESYWPLLLIAFLGTLNPSSGDVSAFLPLEQALLTGTVSDDDRTAIFARYSLVGSLAGAAGTLAAGAADLFDRSGAVAGGAPMAVGAVKAMFVLYAVLGLAAFLVYRGLAVGRGGAPAPVSSPLGPSRGIVLRLAALFSLDSFAGGFVVQSMLALWLFARFDLSVAAASLIFFWTNILAALSYLAAVPLARRIGLINTMVFTHLPANLCLVAVPFVPDLWLAVALLLARGLLSQMDVPTRTSYVMAVVTPAERAAAASFTAVPRSLASAASPSLAGLLLSASGFGWPLLIGGALKVVYDCLLLAMFRQLRPPEESARSRGLDRGTAAGRSAE